MRTSSKDPSFDIFVSWVCCFCAAHPALPQYALRLTFVRKLHYQLLTNRIYSYINPGTAPAIVQSKSTGDLPVTGFDVCPAAPTSAAASLDC